MPPMEWMNWTFFPVTPPVANRTRTFEHTYREKNTLERSCRSIERLIERHWVNAISRSRPSFAPVSRIAIFWSPWWCLFSLLLFILNEHRDHVARVCDFSRCEPVIIASTRYLLPHHSTLAAVACTCVRGMYHTAGSDLNKLLVLYSMALRELTSCCCFCF